MTLFGYLYMGVLYLGKWRKSSDTKAFGESTHFLQFSSRSYFPEDNGEHSRNLNTNLLIADIYRKLLDITGNVVDLLH